MDFDPVVFAKAVTNQYRRKATLLSTEDFYYPSPPRLLWSGKIYIYKLAGREWPRKIFVFSMPKTDGRQVWLSYKEMPKWPTPRDAVKAALRNKWAEEMELGISI